LPPVRALAGELGVTAPTIQRVIDRLEATGLVSVKRGSGVTINDPHRSGELSLLPLWFDALSDQPDRAAKILGDFLELRRVVAAQLIRTSSANIARAGARLVELSASLSTGDTLDDIVDADLAFTRAVIEASDQFAVKSLFHTTEQLVREVPHVAEALYGDRAYHRRVLRSIATALGAGAGPTAAATAIEAALAAWDRRTVARFRDALATVRP
jgi:DNA-binding FadR family transcriptional regulator